MKNKTKYRYIISLAILSVLFILPSITLALPDYTPLAPLPGTFDSDTGKTTLATYLPGAFTFLISAAGVLAFVMITYAGIQYMTTDAVYQKGEARETLKNAVYGLLLVLASYAILYTINPRILVFDLNLKRINIKQSATVTGSSGSGATAGQCNDCQNLGTLPRKDGLDNTQVNKDLLSKLNSFNEEIKKENVNWRITEAYPPTRNHQNSCHKVGTCVDANIEGTHTPENVVKFAQAAQASGLYVEYEVKSNNAQAQALTAAGFKVLILPDKNVNGTTVEQITAPHFSVYRNTSKN